MSAYNSCLDSEIPVVYTAVSDPVGAGLADEEGNSVGISPEPLTNFRLKNS